MKENGEQKKKEQKRKKVKVRFLKKPMRK